MKVFWTFQGKLISYPSKKKLSKATVFLCIEYCSPKIHIHLEPENGILLGNEVFEVVINEVEMTLRCVSLGPRSDDSCPSGDREEGQ